MEHRSIESQPPDPGRPSVVLPPVRDLIRPVAWALLPAVPTVALVGWQPAVVVGVVTAVIRGLDRWVARASYSFADGFLPFRPQNGWPHGVQEDDEVRWNWAPVRRGHGAHG